MGMIVRPCNFGDRAELVNAHAMQREAYEVEAALIGSREIPALIETVEQLAASRESFIGAYVDSSLVGLIATEVAADDTGCGVLTRISRLAVQPRCFRSGIGRALVRRAISDFSHGTTTALLVSTGSANRPGRRLYESEGFRLVGEREVGRLHPVLIAEYRWVGPSC